MGTLFRLVFFAPSEEIADAAAAAAWGRVDAFERAASDYDAASEARRLGETPEVWTPVGVDLAMVLRASNTAWKGSGGAFDPTVGNWTKLWRRALRQGEWPSAERWEAAVQGVGWRRRVELREGARGLEARLAAPTRLDFGGIAKGIAVDEALAYLDAAGITSALMDGGGDVASLGPPPGEPGWKVEVRPFGEASGGPILRFVLTRGAIATSGDAYQAAELQGERPPGVDPIDETSSSRFGHVLDARTLQPLPSPRAAVVTAGTATAADAWATALVVLGEPSEEPELYEGLADGVRAGMFFPSLEADPCVGDLFPHDGVRLSTSPPTRSEE
jgi:thiamine biosynthesis lipoprotein